MGMVNLTERYGSNFDFEEYRVTIVIIALYMMHGLMYRLTNGREVNPGVVDQQRIVRRFNQYHEMGAIQGTTPTCSVHSQSQSDWYPETDIDWSDKWSIQTDEILVGK